MQPSLAVVIPNHNYGQWVCGSILSAAKQNYPITIYVVDDRSTDNSVENINKLFTSKVIEKTPVDIDGHNYLITDGLIGDVRLVLIENKGGKGGPSFARNLALKFIAGTCPTDVVAFLDADDEWLPRKAELCVQAIMMGDGQVGAAFTDYETVNEAGLVLREYYRPFNHAELKESCTVHSGSFVLGRLFWEGLLFPEDMRVCEDYWTWLTIAKTHFIYHVPLSLSRVRIHSGNSTATVDKRIWEAAWRRIKEEFGGS